MTEAEYIDERKSRLKSHYSSPETAEHFFENTETLKEDLDVLKEVFIPRVVMFEVDSTFDFALEHLKKGNLLDAEVYFCKMIHDTMVTGGWDIRFKGITNNVYDPSYIGKLARVYALDKQLEYI